MGTWEPEGGGETKNQQLLFLVHKKNENLSGAFVQNANQDTSVEALLEALFTRILFMPSTVPGFR